jgi:nitrate reductase gamma subunit
MTVFLSALLYIAAAVFVIGMGWRVMVWLRTPAPLHIVLTPAPRNAAGVARRLGKEMFGFRSLYKADRVFWIPAWLFHVSLVMLFLGHVGGLVVPKISAAILGLNELQFENLAQNAGSVVGAVAVASLIWLFIQRCAGERSRHISTFGDYFALILLLFIIGTGNHMRFVGGLNIVQTRQFVLGWLALHPAAPPANPVFVAHIILVSALLIYIPFSKLVHMGGAMLLSPTLNQPNNPRERRYGSAWIAGSPSTRPK